jgi:hypothetical protein
MLNVKSLRHSHGKHLLDFPSNSNFILLDSFIAFIATHYNREKIVFLM